jgi:hypothetical protein
VCRNAAACIKKRHVVERCESRPLRLILLHVVGEFLGIF